MASSSAPKSNGPTIELSIVVPVYKEAENIRPFLGRAESVLAKLKITYGDLE